MGRRVPTCDYPHPVELVTNMVGGCANKLYDSMRLEKMHGKLLLVFPLQV